jgi:hypothetical protein
VPAPNPLLSLPLSEADEATLRAFERRLAAQIRGSPKLGPTTTDRAARTAPARASRERQFLEQAGGDPVRAEHLRAAYFMRLALESAASRRRQREARNAATREEVTSEASLLHAVDYARHRQ